MYRKNRRSCDTMVNLLFYDWRVLLCSRCAFEGSNVIVKYHHLTHVSDCLFMWIWVMMKRRRTQLICTFTHDKTGLFSSTCRLRQKPCVNCHNNRGNWDTIAEWYQDVIPLSFFSQTFIFSVHIWSGCDCDMWLSLQINKLHWIRLVMKWYSEDSSHITKVWGSFPVVIVTKAQVSSYVKVNSTFSFNHKVWKCFN